MNILEDDLCDLDSDDDGFDHNERDNEDCNGAGNDGLDCGLGDEVNYFCDVRHGSVLSGSCSL